LGASALAGAWRRDGSASSPLAAYPEVASRLRREADRQSREFSRAGLELSPSHGAFARALDVPEVSAGHARGQALAPDSLLTFAIDVADATYVAGELTVEPARDLRAGLRVSVLCDDTLVAAPMVAAPEWSVKEVTDAAPRVVGPPPARTVSLAPWLLAKGRRYLTVAAPHFRDGGVVRSLLLRRVEGPVAPPLFRFALITDTHVRREGREDWMNRKMGKDSAPEFARTLSALAAEGMDFIIHGGDMTERATRDEFALMASVLNGQPLPVYCCIGNHDRYLPTSRDDAREILAGQFPGGRLDYVFHKRPLRFVVMDVEIEQETVRDAKLNWLRATLAADRSTPTVFVWHYAPYNRAGMSSCGFRVPDWSQLGKDTVLAELRRAPNVFATLNGHDHWDEVNTIEGITHVQNAAFVEWPNTYRVFRVYGDRVEWEVRQVANRGFVRESFLPEKAMSWMIATAPGDLTGQVPLRRRS
jgi:hypothetical protein